MNTITHKVWEFPGNSVANKRLVRTDHYEFRALNPETLVVNRNGVEKAVKVVSDSEFVYKMLKSFIRARDGADGLVKFLNDPFWEYRACEIMDFMIDKMKPVKL